MRKYFALGIPAQPGRCHLQNKAPSAEGAGEAGVG